MRLDLGIDIAMCTQTGFSGVSWCILGRRMSLIAAISVLVPKRVQPLFSELHTQMFREAWGVCRRFPPARRA